MSILTAIRYRLFEGEEPAVSCAIRNETHDFGGELVLTFQNGQKRFISWVSEPIQYAVGTNEQSHFVPDAALSDHDVSDSAMWAGLLGQDVSFRFIASNNQILEIFAATDRVLVCSFEHGDWCADGLTICKQAPSPHDT